VRSISYPYFLMLKNIGIFGNDVNFVPLYD
jgi:hypothetical protein